MDPATPPESPPFLTSIRDGGLSPIGNHLGIYIVLQGMRNLTTTSDHIEDVRFILGYYTRMAHNIVTAYTPRRAS